MVNRDVSRTAPQSRGGKQHAGTTTDGRGDGRTGHAHLGEWTHAEDEQRAKHDVERVGKPEHPHRDRGVARATKRRVDHEQHEHARAAAKHDAGEPAADQKHIRAGSHESQQIRRKHSA